MTENKTLPLSHHKISIILSFNNKKKRQLACVYMKHLHGSIAMRKSNIICCYIRSILFKILSQGLISGNSEKKKITNVIDTFRKPYPKGTFLSNCCSSSGYFSQWRNKCIFLFCWKVF